MRFIGKIYINNYMIKNNIKRITILIEKRIHV